MQLLVTAASRNGSTSEIARTIGDVLQARGLTVTVSSPDELSAISEFDAVVIADELLAARAA
jgi:menaquinone-dependent protoporphyrinogen oxidase